MPHTKLILIEALATPIGYARTVATGVVYCLAMMHKQYTVASKHELFRVRWFDAGVHMHALALASLCTTELTNLIFTIVKQARVDMGIVRAAL